MKKFDPWHTHNAPEDFKIEVTPERVIFAKAITDVELRYTPPVVYVRVSYFSDPFCEVAFCFKNQFGLFDGEDPVPLEEVEPGVYACSTQEVLGKIDRDDWGSDAEKVFSIHTVYLQVWAGVLAHCIQLPWEDDAEKAA